MACSLFIWNGYRIGHLRWGWEKTLIWKISQNRAACAHGYWHLRIADHFSLDFWADLRLITSISLECLASSSIPRPHAGSQMMICSFPLNIRYWSALSFVLGGPPKCKIVLTKGWWWILNLVFFPTWIDLKAYENRFGITYHAESMYLRQNSSSFSPSSLPSIYDSKETTKLDNTQFIPRFAWFKHPDKFQCIAEMGIDLGLELLVPFGWAAP